MKFAFLVHPLGNDTDQVMSCLRHVDLQQSFKRGPSSLFHDLHLAMSQAKLRPAPAAGADGGVRVIDEMFGLRSKLDASVDGRLYEIPMHALAILDDPTRAVSLMLEATGLAHDWGAGIVGLGAMTGVVGGHGAYLADHGPVPVTTGNGLTVYAAIANLEAVCRDVGIELEHEDVAVVGVPGSIATAAARLLRPRCRSLALVARQPSARATSLARELDAGLFFGCEDALRGRRVILSATSSGGCIDQELLAPGTVVSDIGVPTDVIGNKALRPDVLILSGGLCVVPDTMPYTSHYLWFHRGAMAACVAETIILALDDTLSHRSLGRDLDVAHIAHLGRRAEAHGFSFSRLFSFGQPLDDAVLSAFRKACAKVRRPSPNGGPQDRAGRAVERFRRHMNPAMIAAAGALVKTWVKGEGTRVWDVDGTVYLDFVAGFGALNLGHNHPVVTAALQRVLRDGPPGFSPAAVNPFAAALAERLVGLAPPGLEMVFFTNSGAEAVEATLKLCKRATARPALLYCEGSFHGKTLGALSVTGNARYQRPFAPLLPACEAVPFGDLEAVAGALASRRFGAFLVEPIQCEGGMITPPPGYLRAVQALCRDTGTLLAVDEVQTGLGRVGTLFAVEREGVEPDVMALAKSLGGGLMPIGAMLTRRDLWKEAYGSFDSFALHTSTFGGGSLAAAAALATLDVLEDTDVMANVAARGRQLRDGLEVLAGRHPLIKAVRGAGLLIGVECEPPPAAIVALWQGLISNGGPGLAASGLESALASLNATWIMALLLQEHGIYVQVARSHPNVLRVEPPLILSEAEADRFLEAFAACVAEVESRTAMLDEMTAKAIRGQHGRES